MIVLAEEPVEQRQIGRRKVLEPLIGERAEDQVHLAGTATPGAQAKATHLGRVVRRHPLTGPSWVRSLRSRCAIRSLTLTNSVRNV